MSIAPQVRGAGGAVAEPADATRERPPLDGLLLSVVLSVGTALSAVVGLGQVSQLAYPVVAVGVAAVLLLKGRHASFLDFVLWLWLLSPEVRRVVDWRTGWHSLSYIMVAAPIATLLCLLPALRNVRRLHTSSVVAFVVTLIALGYGTAVGIVRTGVGAPAADILQWVPPLALGMWIANSRIDRRDLQGVLTRTAVVGGLVLGVYALVQFFLLPAWDSFWFANAPLASLGTNEPLGVRVWSLLNSPGPLATVLIAFMALAIASTSRWRWFAFGLSTVALGLSLVRAAWVGFAVLLLVLLTRMKKASLAVMGALGVVVVLLLLVGGPIGAVITDRFDSSVASGSNDVSYTERVNFHLQTFPVVVADPVGRGLGASGVATKIENGGNLTSTGNFDGGALQVLFAFGPVVGTVLLVAVLIAGFSAWSRSRYQDAFTKVCAAAGIALLSQLVFGNPFTSVSGVVLWIVLGVTARRDDEDEAAVPGPTAVAARG